MVALLVSKKILSRITICFFAGSILTFEGGPASGQPSSSWKPLMVSGSLGHLSALSGTPSLSLSGSGQPSSSSKPSTSSGASLHWSNSSGMPSPSLSGSGQPSSSSKPSLSSASLGHLSMESGTPSPSVSVLVGGQPPS